MNEKDFLQGYEIRNWEFSPRIYKIIAVAAVFNIVGLLGLAQTNIISASACQSPFVKNVCSVLDTVYVGSKLFSGEKDYVNKIYDKTEIADADVVWVDSTNAEPQLSYPTGYFEIANRDELAMKRQQDEMIKNGFDNPNIAPNPAPKPVPKYIPPPVKRIPQARNGGLIAKKQNLPSQKKNVTKGEIKDDLFTIDDSDENTAGNGKDNGKGKGTEENKNPIKDKAPTDSNAVTEVEINKKPLQDFADEVVVRWAKKEIDLNQQFVVRLVGKIQNDGRLDRENSRFDPKADQGNEEMVNLAKKAIEAVGDSGWLTYLRNLGAENITITLMQNNDNIVVRVESQMKNEREARTMASGMNTLLSTTKQFIKLGEDETKLLNSAKTPTYRENIFILDLQMSKPEAQEIMNRKLNEALAKKQKEQNGNQTQAQPNGTAKQNDSRENLAR